MRIGVVTTSFPRTPGEPAGGFVAELSQWIASQGHQVEVVAAGRPGADEEWQDVPVTRVLAAPGLFYAGGAPDALRKKKSLWHALRFQARLVREVRKRANSWDGLVAHWLAPSALASVLGSTNKPIWAIAHGGDVYLLERLKLVGVVARLLDRPNVHLSFVSKSVQEVFARNAGRAGSRLVARSTVTSMGIDLARFPSLRARQPKKTKPLVLFLGRLVPIKGVDTFIESLCGLDRSCEVIIAGSGPMEESLKAQAAKSNLDIRWTGEVRGEARDQLLLAADVVVVPSREHRGRTEGMPLVAIEALASGAQLLASRSGGLGEIPSSICHRVDPADPSALRGALREILDGNMVSQSPEQWLASKSWTEVAPLLLRGLNSPQASWRSA